MKFEMNDRDRRTRSSSASSKLEGLLQELINNPNDKLDQDDGKGSPTGIEEIPVSDHASPEATSSSSTPRKSTAGKSPRKRRRREAGGESGGKSGCVSHVMKFRDRQVDLAQFDDNTSMYVLCRAWMMNNPSQTALQTEHLPLSPSQNQQTQLKSTAFSSSAPINSSVAPLLAAAAAAQAEENSKEIWHLPPPEKEQESDGDEHLKGLPAEPLSLDLHADQRKAPATDDLKKKHTERWKKVRACWRDHLTHKQARYSRSLALLREVWQQHQDTVRSSSERVQWES